MVEFDGRAARPQVDGQETQPQADGRQRRHAIDLTAPSGVQEMGLMTIDDFEDSTLSEYRYDTGSFSIQDTVVKEGSKALRIDSGSNEHISSFPGDGLDYYPEAGDTFRFWVKTSVGEYWILLYFGCVEGSGGVDDRPDGYAAFLNFKRSELRLRKRDNNTNNTLSATSYTFATDVWYEVEVQWGTNGTITVRLFDEAGTELGSVSATDTTFTSGGITWQTEAQKGVKYMDYAREVA